MIFVKKIGLILSLSAASLLILSACTQSKTDSISTRIQTATSVAKENVTAQADVDYGSLSDRAPSESLAMSVLSSAVISQLSGSVNYNGADAFVVNHNKPEISVSQTTPYFNEPALSADKQLNPGVAVVNNSTYQGSDRSTTTSNGKANDATINPAGWHQMKLAGSPYNSLYNRGHSLGYAIVGNLKGFDASEANPNNISTQTAWANQAYGGNEGDGQNFFEGIVRDAIKNHETLKYEVKPIYVGKNLLPSGSEIEAEGIGNSISFNVFVPNVEPGVAIDYATGLAHLVNGKSSADSSTSTQIASAESSTNADSNSQRTVYVASHGKSTAYWYNASDMPSGTNQRNVVTMTESEAIAAGKHHAEEEN